MPSTTVVVACIVGLSLLIVLILVARGRRKTAEPEMPPFEPLRELAPRPAKSVSRAATSEPATQPLPPPPSVPAPVAKATEAYAPVEELVTDPVIESPTAPPPPAPHLPRAASTPDAARHAMPSYSDITDEMVADEIRHASITPSPSAAAPKLAAPVADADITVETPALSEPMTPATPEAPTATAQGLTARPAVATPKMPAAAARPAVATPKMPAAAAKPAIATPKMPAAAAKPAIATATAPAAKFAPPSNPATAELEKGDPRHAAARRFARLSVSEIKLYHEDEVKAGREAKDLWKRLQQHIALARQTFDVRVASEVRERFDYLYDEILRQLAEGDASKLGPDAPTVTTDNGVDSGVPTHTVRRTPEPVEPKPAKTEIVQTTPPKPIEPPAAAASAPAKPEGASKPMGLAARAFPSNPETAELEKNDPRHAAARRLARLSVSEIKLYHEDEVKAGREAKDLWRRMSADIALATQTFEKRVDEDVRDRFDYLYDEILRQLAEGDVSKLGPDAPKPKKATESKKAVAEPATATAVVVAAAPKASSPKAAAPAASGLAARYAPPSNPATAELEKSDPRHAAARRLARLSVSEIKLYHEDEVKAGREAKDLWRRMSADIGLAMQTFEKRIDKDVRDRFDYLYDEILRQLAEGDVSKLGSDAPRPNVDA